MEGALAWSSNATFLVTASYRGRVVLAVYKPRSGERPLWDFPTGTLCARETAAYVVSRALGWDLVPPTVLRKGPAGFGAVQRYIPHDPEEHYLAMEEIDVARAMRIAAFDVVINNADRKSGHVLFDPEGRMWGIDHGLGFNAVPKLRTVIWEFAGQALPAALVGDLDRLADSLTDRSPTRDALLAILDSAEVVAVAERARRLARSGRFPNPDPDRRSIPWPPV